MPVDKVKNANEMLAILNKAYSSPPSIITFTEDYVYAMFPTGEPERWMEVSFITPDGTLDKKELSSKDAIMYLIKEIAEGLSSYFDTLPIVKDKASFEKAVSKIKGVMK
jgi:hypothetical protein